MGKLAKIDQNILLGLIDGVEKSMQLVVEEEDLETGRIARHRPFFMSLTLKKRLECNINVSNGAIVKKIKKTEPLNYTRSDIRVGHYERGGSDAIAVFPVFPSDNNMFAFRRNLWEEINEAMYEALRDLQSKRVEAMATPEEFLPYVYFSREDPEEYYNPRRPIFPDIEYWGEILKRASKLFIRDEIIDSGLDFAFDYEKRFYVNSEGTKIVDSRMWAEIGMRAAIRGEKNLVFKNSDAFFGVDLNSLPDEERIMTAAEKLIRELYEIRKAPQELSGSYPCIMDSVNFEFLWHEAFGHSGEYHRQVEKDGQGGGLEDFFDSDFASLVLMGRLGKKIAPEFITVVDDPTLPGHYGSYKYDEDGVPAQKVVFIENGILKNYFHSRESAGSFGKALGKNIKSNGHSRNSLNENPIPRMSNLLIRSSNEHSMDELKEMLCAECRKRGMKYGLILEDALEGFVDDDGNHIKTFPKNIFRLYPDGKKERVRGLYLNSNPGAIMENIVATSGNYRVINGTCGAESGFISSSGMAPDAFIKSVTFGVIPRNAYAKRKPLLSKPPRPPKDCMVS